MKLSSIGSSKLSATGEDQNNRLKYSKFKTISYRNSNLYELDVSAVQLKSISVSCAVRFTS